MRAVGLISEYNPFHNGHLHHLQQSREESAAGIAVAVMSGHFLQRGEPALLDKWQRTRMALAAGVDVVLELPLPWACNSAPHFAEGAVRLLAAAGVDTFCFGSESGELAPLAAAAEQFCQDEQALRDRSDRSLASGARFPAFCQERFAAAGVDLSSSPNDILGIAYLAACRRLRLPLTPLTIRRRGAGYHDLIATGAIASATGIRAMLARGEDVVPYLPAGLQALLTAAASEGALSLAERWLLLAAARLGGSLRPLASIYQMPPGLDRHLRQALDAAGSLAELQARLKVRHLTATRLQRLLVYALLDAEADIMKTQLQHGPLYLRLLGTSRNGERWLAATRKLRTLPLLTNLSRAAAQLNRFYGTESAAAHQQLAIDCTATRLYSTLVARPQLPRNRDFTTDPLRVD